MEDFAPEAVEIAQSFIAMDAPRHNQLRGITMDAFKPKNMRPLVGWIQGALLCRSDIDMAKGGLMALHGCDPDEAFAKLVAESQDATPNFVTSPLNCWTGCRRSPSRPIAGPA